MLAFDAEARRVEHLALTDNQRAVCEAIVVFLGIRPWMKFTPHVVSTWCRLLGEFDMRIVNSAVIDCALSRTEHVGLPQIFQRCRELSRDDREYSPIPNEKTLPKSLIKRVAKVLGVDA